jgi:ABC-type transport system substrate-binding protein
MVQGDIGDRRAIFVRSSDYWRDMLYDEAGNTYRVHWPQLGNYNDFESFFFAFKSGELVVLEVVDWDEVRLCSIWEKVS